MKEEKAERIGNSLVSLIQIYHVLRNRSGGPGVKPPPMDPAYYILCFLCHENITMSELGRRLQRSKPNMTAIIGKMAGEGMVRRIPDGKDRRIVKIAITAAGRRYLESKKKVIKESIKKNIAKLEGRDLETLCESLENVNAIVLKLSRD